jgi:ABC-type multidrug transport system permease subunit
MLVFLDILLTIVHLAIVAFNLFAWIPRKTRKAHFISILLTAASWFLLGIWFGMGYCPVTEWQWNVKEKLGERNLPDSFIKYFADKFTGQDFDPGFINTVTAVCFAAAAVLSVYVNFFRSTKLKHATRRR